MTKHTTTSRRLRRLPAAVAITLALAACGSDTADPAGEPLPDPGVTAPGQPPADGEVIGTANMGGTVVDPKPHPIDGFVIAESFPEQIGITFTAGDPNCTAADARAVATDSQVRVVLDVGITEDALARSCLAGDVEHSMMIPLIEGLDGRDVTVD